ncbi:MAG: methyltransferase domain-containing protein [Proteobacteria bacterium]|nr:methyltransferase domain-containing protein [Pseudomonadota bacterium]
MRERGLELEHRRPDATVRAQPQVDAIGRSEIGRFREQPHHLLHGPLEELLIGAGLRARGPPFGRVDEHQVDVTRIVQFRPTELSEGDLIIDIGSNDATTLRAYPDRNLQFLGVDPTGEKFKSYYPSDVRLIADFFNARLVKEQYPGTKAKVITSFSMFYDLEDPVAFMKDIEEVLHPEGIWVFEQSYLKSMIETNSYDTICHEHLEYYGVKQIVQMAGRSGLKVIDVELNDVNGGSFSIVAAKKDSKLKPESAAIERLLNDEEKTGLYSRSTYADFAKRVSLHRENVRKFFDWAASERKRIIGYGASTKGNVLLQYCGITGKDMPCIAEVNEDKFGAFTPGTLIPIVSEAAAKRMYPDYFFVLPWHFKAGILNREKAFQALQTL